MRFFLLMTLALWPASSAFAQEDAPMTPPLDTAEAVEGVDTAEPEAVEIDPNDPEAVQLRDERRKQRRKRARERRNSLLRKDYSRELLALVGLLILWLLTRKHNREQSESRPVRVSPLTPDELGRALFGLIRSGDSKAYRALYLTGGEARELFGAAGVEVYLEGRSGAKLEEAFQELAGQVPVGAQYKGCFVQEEICVLEVTGSDGKEVSIRAGRVALVGAVIRLVSPSG